MSKQETKTVRNSSYDSLKIIAAFCVVLLHAAAQLWYTDPVGSFKWLVENAYDALSRIGVPLFVMISGALFLRKDKLPDTKSFILRNVLRLVVIYFLWSAVYGVWTMFKWECFTLSFSQIVKTLLNGCYHLWYLPMQVGLYLLTPLLHPMVRSVKKEGLEYFLWLFFLFQVVRQTLMAALGSEFWTNRLDQWEIGMVCSYIGYYLLGYYLAEYGLPEKARKVLKIGFLPAALWNIVFSSWQSIRFDAPCGGIYDSFCLGTVWMAVTVFVCVTTQNRQQEEKKSALLEEIAKDTFGVYLMHVGLLEVLLKYDIHTQIVPNYIGIPLMAAGAFLVCLALSALLRRIPVIGRYIC